MFFLFAGSSYYPEGGMEDYVGSYEILMEAQEAFDKESNDWGHVARLTEKGLVKVSYYTWRTGSWAPYEF